MIGSQDNSSTIIRYYKTSKKLFNPVKNKSLPKQKQQKHPNQTMLIQQLQVKVIKGQQSDLVLQSSCQCTICTKQKQPALQNYNYLATVSNSYLNLFTLLQHLTMIQPEQNPTILGDLLIPTILFKCSFKNNKNTALNKKLGHQNQSQNFIMFKSNSKNGNLEYPTYISSYEKIIKILQIQQQQIRKRKHQQIYKNVFKTQQLKQAKITNKTNSSDLQNMTKVSKIVHKENFNQQIPSFILPLVEKHQKYPVQRYIIHNQKTYMDYLYEHKMMLTQPLCIFRYQEKQSQWEFGKYQIFTIQTLSLFIKNKQVTSKNNKIKAHDKKKIQQVNLNKNIRLYEHLNLIYIQSYTKTKPQQIKHITKHGQNNNKQNNSLSIVHYSQFDQQIKSYTSSYMFNIVKLEIQIKLGKANRTSQFYMDSFQLEETLMKLLLVQQKISNRKVELNVQYKTYKIIHVLEQVCRIKVKKLKLKWLLNDHDEIVLQQCLVYQINRLKSLQPFKKKKDAHAAHILDYGNLFLTEKFKQEINYNHFEDLNQVIKYKMEQKAKCKTQPKTEDSIILKSQNKQIIYLKAKQKINNNLLLKLNLNKTLPLKPIKTIIRIGDTLDQQTNNNHYSKLIEHIKFINKLTESQTLHLETEKRNRKQVNFNNIKPTYGGVLRKSYKLRPYKTETNSPIKHE